MTNKNKKKYKVWTSSEEELLERLYSKGMKVSDIADFFPDRTIKQVRAKYDYKFANKKKNISTPRKWTAEEERILKENYNVPWSELLELLPKRSRQGIVTALNRRGLKRHRVKVTDEVEQNILDMISSYTVTEIASQLRLSKQSVYTVLKKHGKRSYRNTWVLKDAQKEQNGSDFSVTFTIKKERLGDFND